VSDVLDLLANHPEEIVEMPDLNSRIFMRACGSQPSFESSQMSLLDQIDTTFLSGGGLSSEFDVEANL